MTIAKGAVITELNKPWEIQELEWEDPRDDEVGVRIAACGVCHSDYHFTNGTTPVEPLPYLSGHEGTGIVETVGKNVKRVKPGDKIVMSWMPSCGHCPSCVSGLGQLCDRGTNLLTGARDDGTYRIRDKKGRNVGQAAALGAFACEGFQSRATDPVLHWSRTGRVVRRIGLLLTGRSAPVAHLHAR